MSVFLSIVWLSLAMAGVLLCAWVARTFVESLGVPPSPSPVPPPPPLQQHG